MELLKKTCTQFITRMAAWLLLTFFICIHNQLNSMHSIITYLSIIITYYLVFEKWIHQIDSKNEWLLLSGSIMAIFGLVFVLTLEKPFS